MAHITSFVVAENTGNQLSFAAADAAGDVVDFAVGRAIILENGDAVARTLTIGGNAREVAVPAGETHVIGLLQNDKETVDVGGGEMRGGMVSIAYDDVTSTNVAVLDFPRLSDSRLLANA